MKQNMILWLDLLDIHLSHCFKRAFFKDFSPTCFKINRIHLSPAKVNRTADPRVCLLQYHWSHTHGKAFLDLFPLLSFNCSGRDCNPTAYFSFSQHLSALGNRMHVHSTSLPALVLTGQGGNLSLAHLSAWAGKGHLLLQNTQERLVPDAWARSETNCLKTRSVLARVFFETMSSNIHARKHYSSTGSGILKMGS